MRQRKIATATSSRVAEPPKPEINVTPLVDVVLVLLIIFMVIAPNLQEGTPVLLPEVGHPDEKKRENVLEVVMTPDGRFLMDDVELDKDAMLSAVRQQRVESPDRDLVLKADAKLPYGAVREVFASLSKSGFRNVSLKVASRKEES